MSHAQLAMVQLKPHIIRGKGEIHKHLPDFARITRHGNWDLHISSYSVGYTTIFCWISPSFGLTCLADTSSLWRTKAARSTWPLRLFHAPKKPWLQAEDPTKSNRLELMVWQLVTTYFTSASNCWPQKKHGDEPHSPPFFGCFFVGCAALN